jgi:hypothetical protein
MAHAETHIIQRQVFELSIPNSKEGFECQALVSNYLQQLINPQLEACFNQLQLGNRHLVIDKLEIDLGSFTIAGFEKEVTARLKEMLDSKLRSYLDTATRKTATTDAVTGEVTITEKNEPGLYLLDESGTLYTVLHYFLVHGRLPWWYKDTLSTAQFNHTHIDALTSAEKIAFAELIRSSTAARIRLVNHFTVEWLAHFLQQTGLAGNEAAQQWTLLAPVVAAFPATEKLFHQHFWLAWIEAAINNIHSINITLLLEKTTSGYNKTAIALATAVHAICIAHQQHTVYAGYAEVIEKYLQHKMPYDAFRKQLLPESNTGATQFDAKQEMEDVAAFEAQTAKDEGNINEDEALFVPASGLVILHPFLKELFTSTGLWENKQWRTEDSVYRGIQLLSQLAFGTTDMPEYQLPFIKIMAGLPVEAPLPAQPPLTNEEKQTCTELLQAVIGHWTALRNSGAAALQEAFLQRQGKLIKNEKGYHITIERLAQDVLLSRLPWGYSMIKLPWMNDMLHVTWL